VVEGSYWERLWGVGQHDADTLYRCCWVAQVLNDGVSYWKVVEELSWLVPGLLFHLQTQPQKVQKELAVMEQNAKINRMLRLTEC
jgi:hypothetical protein